MTEKADTLYRIMEFHHVVQLFTTDTLYFSHPSQWDDPYEVRVSHDWEHMLYAQCWCKKSMSDAMWRIYSQNKTSVRIRTTRDKLQAAMDNFSLKQKGKGFKSILEDVEYFKTKALNAKTEALATSIEDTDVPAEAVGHATKILCLKREAFDHEDEVRAIIYSPSKPGKKAEKGVFIPVDSHDLVESILIDPRAPKELSAAFTHYFKNVLKFKKTIRQSALYNIPNQRRADFVDGEI
jgi:hypothetical protein